MNSRTLRLSASSAALLVATQTWAIGFGDIILHSRVGEPVRAEVPINAEPGETIEATCFSLAQLGGSDLPVVSSAKTKLVREGNNYRLLITGSKPVSEPIFLIGLRAACGVDLQRDYVLMPSEPLVLASVPPPAASNGVDTPAAASRSRSAPIQEWRASEGDTLEGIAETLIPDNLVQQRRMLAALKRANPQLTNRPGLAEGTPVAIPDIKQRVSAERDTLPQQQARPRSEAPLPPPPPPPAPKVAKLVALPKAAKADRVVLGAPPAEIQPGEKPVPLKGSREELDERMKKMETTIQSLNTQIEALDKALALTTEALALQQKLQVAQAAQAASGSVPAPVAKPPEPPASGSGSNWLEILLSALAGGIIAAAIAHFLGRRQEHRVDDELPLNLASRQHAEPLRRDPPAPPPAPVAAPVAANESTEKPGGLDIHLDDFSRAPEDASGVGVKFSHDDSAIALAEIMLTFGRVQGAAETLAQHIEESSPKNPRPWLMLLDLYRRSAMRGEYTKLLPAVREKFNLDVPAWQELGATSSGLKSLEDFAHVTERVQATWGTQACINYLYELVHDNRDGQRSGFPLEVVEEIVLLMLVLEDGYGLQQTH